MVRLSSVFKKINSVDSADPQSRQAYLTRVLLSALLSISLLFTPVTLIGWLLGSIPADTSLILISICAVMAFGLWMSLKKQSPIGSFVLPAIIFTTALYGNFIGGVQAPAMVLYALAITLAAILQGTKSMTAFLMLSLISFAGIGIAQHAGVLITARSWETAFESRLVIFILTMTCIAFSIWLLKAQYEKAVSDAVSHREKYRQLVQYAPAGIYEVDFVKQKFVSVNEAMCEYSGYSREELLEMSPGDLLTEESRLRFLDRLTKFLAGEKVAETVTLEIRMKNGERVWAMLNIRFISENGIPKGAHVIVHNITAIKEAEDKVRVSEEKYRNVVEYANEVIVVIQDGRFKFANRMFTETTGYSAEEIASLSFSDLIHPEDRDWVVERYFNRLKGIGPSFKYEFRVVTKSGSIRWIDIGSVRIDWEGRSATLNFISDITDRKQAEDALRYSEKKFRDLAELLPQLIFETDSHGRLTYVNPSGLHLFGYSREDLAGGINALDVIAPSDRVRGAENIVKVARGEKHGGVEYTAVKKDGAIFPVLIYSTPVTREGQTVGLSGIIIDMTDRKHLEAQLIQSQKMESIGTLAGGIAHDFNNLLMGIQGYVSLMQLDLDASHPHHERLTQITQQIASGADLTKQLLGFARGGRYEVKPTNFNDLIEKTASMFGRTRKEIVLHRRLTGDLWALEVDRGQMEQVLLNLYVNAWQAMPGGGEIHLETENVSLADEEALPFAIKPGRYVKISVIDTGVGMDEKTRERIFDPFFTTKEMGRGTGLGLAMVYGIIKGHDGMIRVYSEPGRGTTFHIYLPASEREVVKAESVAEKILKGTETILLVDDEKTVLSVSRELLKFLGYKVYAAGDGQEAIAVFKEKRGEIDLVILDMIMPGISGGETFDRLREIDPAIRVLLASGYSIEGQAQEILDRGCNGFLQKPFHLEKLAKKVREVLGRE
jgi:two-component system cell cycle sensor histidine kinase/response regulator CckA